MHYENLVYFKNKKVGVIKLNRPESLNALNEELLTELDRLLEDIRKDKQIRVVVITAEGERAFSSGVDLKEIQSLDETGIRSFIELGQKVFKKIRDFEKPFVAAINGFALGGGIELALTCDIRIASENARLGSPEVSIGLVPAWGGTTKLQETVGKGRASELILTGKIINAEEAERIGLVNKIVPSNKLDTEALLIADNIAQNAPVAVKMARNLVNKALESNAQERSKLMVEAFVTCIRTQDFIEGINAKFQKRSPRFKGK